MNTISLNPDLLHLYYFQCLATITRLNGQLSSSSIAESGLLHIPLEILTPSYAVFWMRFIFIQLMHNNQMCKIFREDADTFTYIGPYHLTISDMRHFLVTYLSVAVWNVQRSQLNFLNIYINAELLRACVMDGFCSNAQK